MAASEHERSLQARYEMAVKRIALLEKLVENLQEQLAIWNSVQEFVNAFQTKPTNPTQEDE